MNHDTPDRSSCLRALAPLLLLGAPAFGLGEQQEPTTLPTSSVRVAASMPQGVTSFGAVVHRGWLYTLGGYFGVPHVYEREDQSSAFRRMNLADGTWQELPSPGSMQSVALVAHGEFVYRIGGMHIRNGRNEDSDLWSTDAFERYDPLTQEWYRLPALPEPRSSHMAAVIGDQLYVAGGWQLGGEDQNGPEDEKWHDTMLVYDLSVDPVEGEWREVSAPFRRRALTVAASGGKLYAIGGMDRDAGISRSVDVFDPATGEWSLEAEFPEPGFGMAAVGAAGGPVASGSTGYVYRLDAQNGWRLVTALAFPRFFHQWVAVDDAHQLVVGGIGRAGRVVHIESLDSTAAQSGGPGEVALQHWRLPNPGEARSGQGAFVKGNVLHLFGGSRGMEEGSAEQLSAAGYRLDLGTLTWSTMSDLPAPREAAVAALSEDAKHAMVLGGFTSPAGEAARPAIYDVKMDLWSPAEATLPVAMSGFSVARDGDNAWLMGGSAGDGPTDQVWRATLGEDGVAVESSDLRLPGARTRFASASLDGRVYLVGGVGPDGDFVHRCDVYDPESGSWTEIGEPSTHRVDPQLVALGGKLYLAGGAVHDSEGGPHDAHPLEVFDPETGSWSVVVEDLPVPARHLRMFAFRDRLLLVSTWNQDGQVDVILLDVGQREVAFRKAIFHG